MSASELVHYEMQGTQPDNFTMLPNMAFEDLSPTAFKLLAVYLDTAKINQVYAKNSTIAKKVGVSPNTMKKARQELANKGYIIYSAGIDGTKTTTARVVIQVAWMWSENHKRMSDSDTQPDTVSNSDTPVSNFDRGVSKFDTNNQYLNKQEQKNQEKDSNMPVVEDSPSKDVEKDDTSDIKPELSEVEPEALPDNNKVAKGIIAVFLKTTKTVNKNAYKFWMSEAQELVENNITPAHVAEWVKDITSQDWWTSGTPSWNLMCQKIIAWRDEYEVKQNAPHPKTLMQRKLPANYDLMAKRGQITA